MIYTLVTNSAVFLFLAIIWTRVNVANLFCKVVFFLLAISNGLIALQLMGYIVKV